MRPFRFGYQVGADGDSLTLRREAQAAEDAGFDVLCSSDHLGSQFSALAELAAAAGCTSRIRLCPLVLNNDFHHPALLAQEIASLDRLSDGRVELGIGAGHALPEYAAAGITFDNPTVRKARLSESVGILRRLLAGESVTFTGTYYKLEGATTLAPLQDHLPILVGVNGQAALSWAAERLATTIPGLTIPDALATPFLAVGNHDDITAHLLLVREHHAAWLPAEPDCAFGPRVRWPLDRTDVVGEGRHMLGPCEPRPTCHPWAADPVQHVDTAARVCAQGERADLRRGG